MHFEVAVLQRKVVPQVLPGRTLAAATADNMPAHEIAASAVQTPPLPAAASPPAAPA